MTDYRTRTGTSHWLVLAAVPLVTLGLNWLILPTYTGDDSFIHFTYIRNIVEHGCFAYNSDVPTYGSSSIAWILLGSIFSLVTHNIPATMRVISGVLFAANVFLLYRYVLKGRGLLPSEAVFFLLAYVGSAVMFRWLLTGMETTLVEFVTIVLLWKYDRTKPIRSAGLCIVAYLVRPEFILLPVAHLLTSVFTKPVDWIKTVKFVCLAAAALGVWFLGAWWYFGTPMPLTTIKSSGGLTVSDVLRQGMVIAGSVPTLFLACIVFAGKSPKRILRAVSWNEKMLVLFVALVLGLYAATGTTVLSRYVAVMHVPLFVLFVSACYTSSLRRWLPGVVSIMLGIEAFLFWRVHYPSIKDFDEGFRREYSSIGRMLVATSPRDTAAVMLLDVGMVAYYSGRPILDMNGLVSRHVHEAKTRNDAGLALLYRPRYYVLRLESSVSLDDYLRDFRSRCRILTRADVLYSAHIAGTGVFEGKGWEAHVLELFYTP